MKETWRQQLRQKLADYEEPDPLLSWEEVEAALDRQKSASVIPLWGRRIAAAAAILLMAGGAALYFNHREKAPEDKTPATAEIMDKDHGGQQHADSPQEPPSATIAAIVNRMPRSLVQTSTEETETAQEPVAEQTETATADTTKAEQPHRGSDPAVRVASHEGLTAYEAPHRKTANPLTAKLFFSNTIGGGGSLLAVANQPQMDYNSNKSQPVDVPEKVNPPDISDNPTDVSDSETTTGDEDKDENDDKQARTRRARAGQATTADGQASQVSEHTSHRQPLRFGLLLRYQLSKRWALESGLTYTRLSADITRVANGTAVATIDQSLNYIGIPLSASYLIYKSHHLGFYASGGLLVEKMVYGSRTEAGSRQRVSIGPLQLSVNAGIGAEWRFIPALSLFVEPGVGYYFDNHSTIPTFYQEHPLSFNLNLGLRFSFE
jgi:hypothetical protein